LTRGKVVADPKNPNAPKIKKAINRFRWCSVALRIPRNTAVSAQTRETVNRMDQP
jgi:predicted GTPase